MGNSSTKHYSKLSKEEKQRDKMSKGRVTPGAIFSCLQHTLKEALVAQAVVGGGMNGLALMYAS